MTDLKVKEAGAAFEHWLLTELIAYRGLHVHQDWKLLLTNTDLPWQNFIQTLWSQEII